MAREARLAPFPCVGDVPAATPTPAVGQASAEASASARPPYRCSGLIAFASSGFWAFYFHSLLPHGTWSVLLWVSALSCQLS